MSVATLDEGKPWNSRSSLADYQEYPADDDGAPPINAKFAAAVQCASRPAIPRTVIDSALLPGRPERR